MRITNKTELTEELENQLNCLTDESKNELTDASARFYCGENGYYSLTIADFHALISGSVEVGRFSLAEHSHLVFAKFFLQGLANFAKDFVTLLSELTPPPTAEEIRANRNLLPIGIAESLLIFARSFFGLRSFAEAEQITLADLILAKKETYNKIIFERNQAQDSKQKRK